MIYIYTKEIQRWMSEQLADTLIAYFQQIFATSNHNSDTTTDTNANAIPITDKFHAGNAHPGEAHDDATNASHAANTHQGQDHEDFTNSTPDIHELRTIIKNMRSNASP